MEPKQRIMTIRLLNKMAKHPEYTVRIGIEGSMIRSQTNQSNRSN